MDDETILYTLHVANDKGVIPEDREDLELMAKRLIVKFEGWGLNVNVTKTDNICIERRKKL